jgi:nitric oxide dioxygenase
MLSTLKLASRPVQNATLKRELSTPVISQGSIDIINATAPLVAENALLITTSFYSNMFKRNPEVKYLFNETHNRNQEQPKALSHAVVAFAGGIENLPHVAQHLGPTVHKHCSLSIKPEHYPVVHENLMFTIGQVLGSAVTPEVGAAWSEGVMALSGMLIEREEELYKHLETRKGGWRYDREFVISSKTQLAEDVMGFSLKAADGYTGGFDFDAGQYVALRLANTPHITPRHFNVTSKPGESELQIACRLYEGGKMSGYLHNSMVLNEPCLLSAPCGLFTSKVMGGDKNVLISAGIGVTAMKAHLDSLGKDKINKVVHVEKNSGRHAFASYFKESGVDCDFHYTDSMGLPDFPKMAKDLVDRAGTDATYRICAPAAFITEIKHELSELGCSNIQYEKYGTGTVASKK